MSNGEMWPSGQEGTGQWPGPAPSWPAGANDPGPSYPAAGAPAGAWPAAGGAPYGPAPYGPPGGHPYQGQPHQPFGEEPRPPRRGRALRSAAAVLVLAAAAVAGGGAGRVIWPAGQSVNAAAPGAPSGRSGSSGGSSGGQIPFTVPGGGTSPFGNGTGNGGTGSSEGAGGPSDVAAIAAKVDPALVDVNVTFNYQGVEGAGTGIVLSSNGLVLTNNHVIDEATKVNVTDVGNGRTYTATVVGYDNTRDIAVLQLQGASGLQAAKLAASPAAIGEAVVAIGNAGGTGGAPTSAGGSVTAVGQSITASDALTQSSEQLSGLIEVNANVESGDSGGPLVNASGEVIGMDTAASQGFAFSAQGNQGFAIPLSEALGVVNDVTSGTTTSTVHVGPTGFLGLLIAPANSAEAPFGGGSGSAATGLEVAQTVSGGPAQKAGITGGDVITSFDGKSVATPESLTRLLVPDHPGQTVKVAWVDSSGQDHAALVTLASGPPS